MSKVPTMDYCQFQRFVNNVGGGDGFPAFHPPVAEHHGERLLQYGFTSVQWDPEGEPWPDLPGVYSISVLQLFTIGNLCHGAGSEHVLYIGSSGNIRARLRNNHPWYQRIEKRFFDMDQNLFVRYKVTANYQWEERSLIQTIRPLLNIHHRNG
jgi:hypothetical protein